MQFSQQQYHDYRNRVLAKTDGANVHKINGKLAIILNGFEHLQWCQKNNLNHKYDIEIDTLNGLIESAQKSIKIHVGVSY